MNWLVIGITIPSTIIAYVVFHAVFPRSDPAAIIEDFRRQLKENGYIDKAITDAEMDALFTLMRESGDWWIIGAEKGSGKSDVRLFGGPAFPKTSK